MRFVRTVLLMLAGAASALADTNLFNDGTWLVDGGTDPSTNASGINIVVDKVLTGTFSEVKFYYNSGSNNFTQVFSIKGNGTWQPSPQPPSVPGGVFRLASYWDCEQGLIPPVTVTELGWKSKSANKKGYLNLTAKMSNHNSMSADKMKLRFYPPETNAVRVDLDFQLNATRDFCVDLERHDFQDEFRTVTMYGNYTTPDQHTHDLARYLKLLSKDCAGIYGCVTKKESFCISLTNALPGFLVNAPRHLTDTRMWLMHTTALPQNTPSLAVGYFSPGSGRYKAQGVFTPTEDASTENVIYFGNWVDAHRSYSEKKKVGKFKLCLEAVPNKSPNCEALQTPGGGSTDND